MDADIPIQTYAVPILSLKSVRLQALIVYVKDHQRLGKSSMRNCLKTKTYKDINCFTGFLRYCTFQK